MKPRRVLVIACSLLVAGAMSTIVLAAIHDDARTTRDVEVLPSEASVTTPDGLPLVAPSPPDASFIKLWVRGCVASGNATAFCRCAIAEYTTELQPWEIETAHAVARGGGQLEELPEHVREVVKDVERECR